MSPACLHVRLCSLCNLKLAVAQIKPLTAFHALQAIMIPLFQQFTGINSVRNLTHFLHLCLSVTIVSCASCNKI